MTRVMLSDIDEWAVKWATRIMCEHPVNETVFLYPVMRGGLVPAYNLLGVLRSLGQDARITQLLGEATHIVDDIIDSGATRERLLAKAGRPLPFLAVVDKIASPSLEWVTFPWEEDAGKQETVEDNVRRILQFIGEKVDREGLLETPGRVVKAYQEWFSGYGVDPAAILKTFEDGAESTDEMVVVKDIRFYSHCEHHMAPFFGKATIAYVPDGRIVGLSKLPRLVEVFARRLQVQERLTTQIAETINEVLKPKGVAVLVEARHMCVESRGVRSPDSTTRTSKLLGCMSTPEARAEFLELAK